MKNEPSPVKISLIKIAILGGLGLMLLSVQQLLMMWAYMLISTPANISVPTLVILSGLLLFVTITFLWVSLNVVAGVGIAMTLNTQMLIKLLATVKRLPFKVDRWLLWPWASIIQWTVELRRTPTSG